MSDAKFRILIDKKNNKHSHINYNMQNVITIDLPNFSSFKIGYYKNILEYVENWAKNKANKDNVVQKIIFIFPLTQNHKYVSKLRQLFEDNDYNHRMEDVDKYDDVENIFKTIKCLKFSKFILP